MKLDEQLGYNLYRTALLMRRQLMRALRGYDLTPEQWQTMVSLWSEGRMTPTQIRAVTLQDLPSISRMLTRMERTGWIRKHQDPSDRRSYSVEATPDGRKLQTVIVRSVLAHFDALLADFSRSDQDRLLLLLQ